MKHFDFKNWWYYHKWYAISGIILLGIIISFAKNLVYRWTHLPDYQVAYIGAPLPDDTQAALKAAFESISKDFNGDGRVIVQINQYLSPDAASFAGADAGSAQTAAEVKLIADVTSCESYFFLTDDPDQFQKAYHLLANPDGSPAAESDDAVEDKIIHWNDSVFADQDLGTYSTVTLGQEVTGENQELLNQFSIGRRSFYSDKTVDHLDDCNTLWNSLRRSS